MEKRDNIRAVRVGGAGRLTLDRPEKLNALTLAMVRALDSRLAEWASNDDVRVVIIDGVGRGLSAGGDIRRLHESAAANDGYAARFWTEEYLLIANIAAYGKPVVAIMDGIVMGGGVGISAHARHRIVTETTRVAMPEVGIGLIPDVGGTLLLSRIAGEIGTYLSLTGSVIGAADAIALGLADVFMPRATLEPLVAALGTSDGLADVAATIRAHAKTPDDHRIDERECIDRTFAFDTVEEIVAALRADGTAFAIATADRIMSRSPLALKITLRALREARRLDTLSACLQLEYRLIRRMLHHHDFAEGSDAAVIGKHRSPHWDPATLAGVSDGDVARAFVSLGVEEWQPFRLAD